MNRSLLRLATLILAAGTLHASTAHAQTLRDPAQRGVNAPAVYRPDTGLWYLRSSLLDTAAPSPSAVRWGLPGDVPVPADYTGDRRTDIAVWRPSTGTWFVLGSAERQRGQAGDVPLPRDYDGDGRADYAVWRPSNGTWYFVDSSTGVERSRQFGQAGDVPVPADYTGDGRTDIAVWRPSEGRWHIRDSATDAIVTQYLGAAGDIPVTADYTGDGRADWAVWRPSNHTWYVIDVTSGRLRSQPQGQFGDVPVPADYDGVPGAEFALWRPSTGRWYTIGAHLPKSADGQEYGLSTDLPVPGNFTGAGAFTSPYPKVTPDFMRPAVPQAPKSSPAGGDNDRPVLVISVDFRTRPAPAGIDDPYYANMFFGTIANYFSAQSYGKLKLTPAAETSGTVNDGIVHVRLLSYNTFWDKSNVERGRLALEAADEVVDFSRFDRNGDGTISEDELLIVSPVVHDTFNCGQTAGIAPGGKLDGKELATRRYSGGVSLTNPITFAHELSHQAFDQYDYDGYSVGSFDLHGGTCGLADTTWWGYNAWRRLHLGWVAPTVVTRDGFYRVGDAATTGDAFLLYDPAKGAGNYLLVENRERTAGSYDINVSDEGLAIWRVDESRYWTGTPFDAVVPAAGRPDLAWDPSDPQTPGRTAVTWWMDGTPANVGVRAIGNRGESMWAYFDVRGPGILADVYSLPVQHTKAGIGLDVTFPVRNTGEKADTFTFTLTDVPAGWNTTTVTRTLAANTDATVTLRLISSPAAVSAVYRPSVRAQSTTDPAVSSESSFNVAIP